MSLIVGLLSWSLCRIWSIQACDTLSYALDQSRDRRKELGGGLGCCRRALMSRMVSVICRCAMNPVWSEWMNGFVALMS